MPNNIVKFKQKFLTDNDINSLFLGLVKLIKKNAQETVEERARQEKQNSATLLKEAYLELSKKEKELFSVKENLKSLKLENERLNLRLKKMMLSKTHLKETHA